jgi:nucleoside-diphosphate-sugar epimerase
MQPKILLLGATGYIGGTVLTTLLEQGLTPADKISVLIQKEEQASLFGTLGVQVRQGSRDDTALLEELAAQNDVVMNFAVAFSGDEGSVSALVKGLEARASSSAVKPILLHTGGSGTFLYGQDGQRGTDVWTDEQYDRLHGLDKKSYFYGGYKVVAQAALNGKISAYTLVSPTVYGPGTGPGNKLSLQLPAYVRYAKDKRQAAYIGQGENVWGNVHVQDLADLYILATKHALNNPEAVVATKSNHGFDTLIYTGVDTHTWKPVIEHLGNLLHARGEVDQPSAASIDEGEGYPYMFGGNSFMAVSKKTRILAWKPKQASLIDSMTTALAK